MEADGDPRGRFPKLPIVSPADLPPLSQREKYGGLFYVGIGGLVLLVAMLGYFAYAAWSLRDVWSDVYKLNDPHRPEPERLAAANRLAQSARLGDAQKLALALDRNLPDRARLALAEGVSAELAAGDPRGFSLAVARSPGWPSWLRLTLELNLARGVIRGYAIPPLALEELSHSEDPMIAAVAFFARTVARPEDADARKALELQAAGQGPAAEITRRLLEVLHAPAPRREAMIDEIGRWFHDGRPEG